MNLPTIIDKFGSLHLQDPYALYFPLFMQQAAQPQQDLFGQTDLQPNIKPALLDALYQAYNTDQHEAQTVATALFYHILAVSRAPLYGTENEGYIMQDWPRIPLPSTLEALKASAALGRRVADLLLPDVSFTSSAELRALAVPTRIDGGQFSEADLRVTVRYGGKGRYEEQVAGGGERKGRLWWNEVGYWDNVPQDVWSFSIGGYPVVKKWLDYRHIEKLGRPLRYEEIRYVSEMVQRIAALLALGPVLDDNYAAIKANTLEVLGIASQAVSSWVEP